MEFCTTLIGALRFSVSGTMKHTISPLSHRVGGISLLSPLARLQLARPYAIAGDTRKAKAAYQDFLAL